MQTANNEGATVGDKESTTHSEVSTPQSPTSEPDQAKAQEENQWRADLARLEYEIQTLRNVLTVKIDEASELKRKLGITTIGELKQDFKQSMQSIKESETLRKTNAALKSFGDYASKKIGDIRNSNTFKSVEGKVGVAYTSVKKRVSHSDSQSDELVQPTSPGVQLPTTDDSEELAAMLPESDKPTTDVVKP
jgi:hypothetical protein